MDRQMFKLFLENMSNVREAYVDYEGNEIPIDSQKKLKKAVRFAKLTGQNHLKIVLKPKFQNNANKNIGSCNVKPASSCTPLEKSNQSKKKRRRSNLKTSSQLQQHIKQELLKEVKHCVEEAVQHAFRNEIKGVLSEFIKEMKALNTEMKNIEKVDSMPSARFTDLDLDKSQSVNRSTLKVDVWQREQQLISDLHELRKLKNKLNQVEDKQKSLLQKSNADQKSCSSSKCSTKQKAVEDKQKSILQKSNADQKSCSSSKCSTKQMKPPALFETNLEVNERNICEINSNAPKIMDNCQRKIAENISEIEKRLQNINFVSFNEASTCMSNEKVDGVSSSGNSSTQIKDQRSNKKKQQGDKKYAETVEGLRGDEDLMKVNESENGVQGEINEKENSDFTMLNPKTKEETAKQEAEDFEMIPLEIVVRTKPTKVKHCKSIDEISVQETQKLGGNKILGSRGNERLAARCRSPYTKDETKAKKMKPCWDWVLLDEPKAASNVNKKEELKCDLKKVQDHEVKVIKLQTVDSNGQQIFAVNSRGQCTPLIDLLECEREHSKADVTKNKIKHKQKSSQEKKGLETNQPSASGEKTDEAMPSILPGVLLDGAANMASLALNTAKSVLNNFSSTFTNDSKNNDNSSAAETQENCKYSMKALLDLIEMGFLDIEMNKKLLVAHPNDFFRVIDELIENERNKNN